MGNVYEYKGYFTKIEFSAEDMVMHGKIEGIRDLVNFESSDPKLIEQEFHSAVDDYLELCEELGVSPDRVYSGTFNIRVNPEIHRTAAMMAEKRGISLNQLVSQAIEEYVNPQRFNSKVYLLPESSEILSIEVDPYNYLPTNYKSRSSVLFSQ